MQQDHYRGRFAPSPTGPLHFGSLVTALASYLEARQQQGKWLLRIDDIDQTRCIPGMDQHLIKSLEALGFEWDEAIAYQSSNTSSYRNAIDHLKHKNLIYACHCSRKILQKTARMGIEGRIYPGTCRNKNYPIDNQTALRVRTDNTLLSFVDEIQGRQFQNIRNETGDFIVQRADGYFAYQLAVIVDDINAKISHVVRGADLLLSSVRQLYLYCLLGSPVPHYAHIPLVIGTDGKKLSKSDAAHPIDTNRPLNSLLDAWSFLKQPSPGSGMQTIKEFWPWAIGHWKIERLQDE